MRAAFPRASIEESDYWQDLIKLNTTVVFERVMLVNRHAAHQQYVRLRHLPLFLTFLRSVLYPTSGIR